MFAEKMDLRHRVLCELQDENNVVGAVQHLRHVYVYKEDATSECIQVVRLTPLSARTRCHILSWSLLGSSWPTADGWGEGRENEAPMEIVVEVVLDTAQCQNTKWLYIRGDELLRWEPENPPLRVAR
ncbi:uncharacterized protein LOC143216929 [Lasioglossum baleicum]|uniref:uncharacterized protein LOC143216929 n=1 Tax=Lasioglossum baleicum TaxID=434251 RepID=UPI003FCED268